MPVVEDGRIPCNACTRLATNAAFASTMRTSSFESAIEAHTKHNYFKYKMSWHRQPTASPKAGVHPRTGSSTQPPQLSTGTQGCLLSPSRQCRLSANPTSDTSCRGRARSGSGERRRQMVCCATALTLYSVTRHCTHYKRQHKLVS